MDLPLWRWGRLPSALGKARVGVEVFSQELWGGIKGEITSQSHRGIRPLCICPGQLFLIPPSPRVTFIPPQPRSRTQASLRTT